MCSRRSHSPLYITFSTTYGAFQCTCLSVARFQTVSSETANTAESEFLISSNVNLIEPWIKPNLFAPVPLLPFRLEPFSNADLLYPSWVFLFFCYLLLLFSTTVNYRFSVLTTERMFSAPQIIFLAEFGQTVVSCFLAGFFFNNFWELPYALFCGYGRECR